MRPSHWAPRHRLGGSSEPPPKSAIPLRLTNQAPLEVVADSPEARRKGWRRIVLLFNFFIPGAVQADVGLGPLTRLDFSFELGWGGWPAWSKWLPSYHPLDSAPGQGAVAPLHSAPARLLRLFGAP